MPHPQAGVWEEVPNPVRGFRIPAWARALRGSWGIFAERSGPSQEDEVRPRLLSWAPVGGVTAEGVGVRPREGAVGLEDEDVEAWASIFVFPLIRVNEGF